MEKGGQIWVETVIYTLIGLTVIGLLIAGIQPKIEKSKDRLFIEQAKEVLEEINSEINEIKSSPGNQRRVSIKINKGILSIDPLEDQLIWTIESSSQYSELDYVIQEANLEIVTIEGEPYEVRITLPLLSNLTFNNLETNKSFKETPQPYELILKNKGSSIDIRSVN
jgi:hypothetical protein